mgnify:FL=1
MANILWNQLDKEKQEKYIKRLTALGVLSGLFKELDGKNGRKPYLHYRNHEISFIDSFEVQGITRKDSAFDAIVRVGDKTIGVGLKTWVHNSDSSIQKVAEFNKKSGELRQLFEAGKDVDLVHRVAELRNSRIDDDKRLYETDLDIYHVITRDTNCFYITEFPYEKIDINNIKDIHKRGSSISFNDGKNDYIFNMSKSTLFKRFDASENERILSVKIDIHDDPFYILENIFNSEPSSNEKDCSVMPPLHDDNTYLVDEKSTFDTSLDLKTPQNLPITPSFDKSDNFIMLPLYNDDTYDVNEKSAFNASLASPKTKGSNNPRPEYEAYAQIPTYIHQLYPNFFGFNALDDDARSNSSFNLHFPNGKIIPAKITQDRGKGLQTNPQSELGKWLLFNIFGLKEYEMLTRDIIDEKEIDSIKITKIDNNNFKVDVCSYLDYEKWKFEHKEEILKLREDNKITKIPVFRPELIREDYEDEN